MALGGVRGSHPTTHILTTSPGWPLQPGWVKLLANTHYVLPSTGRVGPHQMLYRDNATAVNTKGVPVLSSASPNVVYDEAYHHHYFIKSREDYEAKIKRGSGEGQGPVHNGGICLGLGFSQPSSPTPLQSWARPTVTTGMNLRKLTSVPT